MQKEGFVMIGLTESLRMIGLENKVSVQCIVAGHFSQLSGILVPQHWRTAKKRQLEIKKSWDIWVETSPAFKSAEENLLISIQSVAKRDGKLILVLRPFKYSYFLATMKERQGEHIRVNSGSWDLNYPLALGFSIAIRTVPTVGNPKGCIFTVVSGSKAFLPEGYLTLERRSKWPKFEDSCKREVPFEKELVHETEKVLPRMDLKGTSLRFLGLVHSLSGLCHPALVVSVEIPYTAEKVIAACGDIVGKDGKTIVCVPADEKSMREFAQKYALGAHNACAIALCMADAMEERRY